jgi:hypothetical protein
LTIWIYDFAILSVLGCLCWFHWTARNIKSETESSTTYFGQPTTAGGIDPLMSMSSQNQQRRGTVTIDLGNGFLTTPGGHGLGGGGGSGGGLSVPGGGGSFGPEMSGISQTASHELEAYAWGPRDGGEAEVLKAEEDDDLEKELKRPVAVDRRDSGRTSPTMK